MSRTITNPSNNSAFSSSVVRNELQTLENEIYSAYSLNGILKSNGTQMTAAAKGDADLILPDQTGKANYYLQTNGTTTSWVLTVASGVVWGNITGTLANQTDLQTALNGKIASTRQLTINGTAYDLSADRTWTITNITGNAGTVTNATLTTALTVNGGTLTLTASALNTSVLTIGAGAVSVSGSNTGDQTNISGNAGSATYASAATIVDDTTTNATMYPLWATANTGNLPLKVSSTKLSFNPSTGTLTATTFSGALSGNATSATTATTATNATNLTTTDDTLTNATYYPAFQTATGGTNPLKTSSTKLTYNPSTGTLSATTFVGALTGTASGNLVSGGALGTPSSGTLTNCTGLPVAGGGTGVATFGTTYGVICAGTTATGALQVIAGVGTAGQVLTSNGAGALPTFQAAAGGGFTSRCLVRMSADQNISANTETKIIFNTKDYDSSSEFDAVTNYRFTATNTGFYLVLVNMMYSGNVISASWDVKLKKNGTTFIYGSEVNPASSFEDSAHLNLVVSLSANDYIEVFVYTSQTTLVIKANDTVEGIPGTLLSIHRLS